MEFSGLIVGLGNPGKEYEGTRHNFGFLAVEALLRACEDMAAISCLSRQKDPFALWRAHFTRGTLAGQRILLTTPLTFMNRSGEAVQPIAAYYRIPAGKILVLHDELDLPFGRMRLKKGGGNAGHNGLASLQQQMGTPDFYRLRLGIGKAAGFSGTSFVLGRFSPDQRIGLDAVLDATVRGCLLFLGEGYTAAQQFCNGFALPETTLPA